MRDTGIRPIDIKEVKKGDYFTDKEVARMYGKKPTDDDFWTCMLQLKTYIETHSDMRCRQLNGGLQIMTDIEFVGYNWAKTKRAVKGLMGAAGDTAVVDTTGFSGKQIAEFESLSAVQQVTAMAAHTAHKKACRERRLFGPRELIKMLGDGEGEK